jgi:hypothetical protein
MQPMLLQRNRLKLLGKQDTLLLLDQWVYLHALVPLSSPKRLTLSLGFLVSLLLVTQ